MRLNVKWKWIAASILLSVVLTLILNVVLALILNTDIDFKENTENFKGVESSYENGDIQIKIGF